MASSVRDLHQDPGHEFHRVDPLALGLLGLVMPPRARVDDLVGTGGQAEPGETHRGAHHVAGQRLKTPAVPGGHIDPVVDGEAASPPRQQQLDPLLAQQPSSAEESQDLVPSPPRPPPP